jgi:hypothetical protein
LGLYFEVVWLPLIEMLFIRGQEDLPLSGICSLEVSIENAFLNCSFSISALSLVLSVRMPLLQNINPHKATGPDEICGRVLKELSTT